MSYVWEEDYDIFAQNVPLSLSWHLKQVIASTKPEVHGGQFMFPSSRPWKVSVAWITRESERKYTARFLKEQSHNDKTFRSLKAAMAYAMAIVTLEN